MANVIHVVPEGDHKGRFKVLIDYVQRGIPYSTAALANREETSLRDREYPNARVVLAKETEKVEA